MDTFYREGNYRAQDGVTYPNSPRRHLAESGTETRVPAQWERFPKTTWNRGEMGAKTPHFSNEKHHLPSSPFF